MVYEIPRNLIAVKSSSDNSSDLNDGYGQAALLYVRTTSYRYYVRRGVARVSFRKTAEQGDETNKHYDISNFLESVEVWLILFPHY